MNSEAKKLSTKEYWDSVLARAVLPRVNSQETFNYYGTMKFIDQVLAGVQKKTILEIGCGSSGWLPYFAQKYNYLVSGLDYSEIGCQLAEQNLKMLNIEYDEIICEDIFKWKPEKKYDVIFSYGVIEHFEYPESILQIIYNKLNAEGIVITLVPNLQGLNGKLFKLFVKDIYDMHKVFSKEYLRGIHEETGFHNIKTEYIGPFFLNSNWEKSQHWLFNEKTIRRKVLLKAISRMNLLMGNFQVKLNMEPANRFFSPYIVSIMKKSRAK